MHERHLLEQREKTLKAESKNIDKRETNIRNEAQHVIAHHRNLEWQKQQEGEYRRAHRQRTQNYMGGILGQVGRDAGQDLANVYFGQATRHDRERYKQFQKNVDLLHEAQREHKAAEERKKARDAKEKQDK